MDTHSHHIVSQQESTYYMAVEGLVNAHITIYYWANKQLWHSLPCNKLIHNLMSFPSKSLTKVPTTAEYCRVKLHTFLSKPGSRMPH